MYNIYCTRRLRTFRKSQIAIAYAHRLRESASHIRSFWIHAGNSVRFEQAYRDIASKVELPRRDNPKADFLRLVYKWLSDEKNGRWLMILDNADCDDVFFCQDADTGQASLASSGKTPLESFLPRTLNGWIFVTSHNLLAAVKLVGGRRNIIQVELMNEEDALALLQSRIPAGDSARALAQTLGCLRLTVTQADAYIRVNQISFSTYLQLLYESEVNRAYLRTNGDTYDGIYGNLKDFFWADPRTKPAASDLFALMSIFIEEKFRRTCFTIAPIGYNLRTQWRR